MPCEALRCNSGELREYKELRRVQVDNIYDRIGQIETAHNSTLLRSTATSLLCTTLLSSALLLFPDT